jgi:hypothetical protein
MECPLPAAAFPKADRQLPAKFGLEDQLIGPPSIKSKPRSATVTFVGAILKGEVLARPLDDFSALRAPIERRRHRDSATPPTATVPT